MMFEPVVWIIVYQRLPLHMIGNLQQKQHTTMLIGVFYNHSFLNEVPATTYGHFHSLPRRILKILYYYNSGMYRNIDPRKQV